MTFRNVFCIFFLAGIYTAMLYFAVAPTGRVLVYSSVIIITFFFMSFAILRNIDMAVNLTFVPVRLLFIFHILYLQGYFAGILTALIFWIAENALIYHYHAENTRNEYAKE